MESATQQDDKTKNYDWVWLLLAIIVTVVIAIFIILNIIKRKPANSNYILY